MATGLSKTRCIICDKEKATFKCGGCSNEFCFSHLGEHKQELNKQLDEIEVNRDLFRQSLTEHIQKPKNDILMQQIDQWERNSIEKIQQTAEEARQFLLQKTNEYIHEIEIKMDKLTNQLQQTRQEDDFNEINIRHFDEELKQLTRELIQSSNISIGEDFTPFINKISLNLHRLSTSQSNICHNTRWIQNGVSSAGGNGSGDGHNQLNNPRGIYIDDEQTMYVADCYNHRIMLWKRGATRGEVVCGENGKGNQMNQLNGPADVIVDKEKKNFIICDRDNRRVMRWPRRNGTSRQIVISNIACSRLTMDNNGYLYVSDIEKHEVRRWKMNDTTGILVAGGNGKGDKLNQLNVPTSIFVDDDQSVYVSDYNNHRVMKWIEGGKEGIVVAGGQGKGNSLAQLACQNGIYVDQLGTVYVVDCGNNRIIRWPKGAKQGDIVVGGNDRGEQSNQFNIPVSLSFDHEGNLYIVDRVNHRVQRFDIDRK